MGGRCYFGEHREIAPECTDNFQIVHSGFTSHGYKWFSIEQAFQALKFPEGSVGRTAIYNLAPNKYESNENYGMSVWIYGSRRPSNGHLKWIMREDWDLEKVKVMYILNLEKYASSELFQSQLVDLTKGYRIVGQPSTPSNRHRKNWNFWNENIQMVIRNLIIERKDLVKAVEEAMKMSGGDAENMLMDWVFRNEE